MHARLLLAAAFLLGCGPSIDATDGSASGDSSASGANTSSGAATADETGQAPPSSMQQIVYLSEGGPDTPIELRSVRADGSDARRLASSEPDTTHGFIVGIREGLVFVSFSRVSDPYLAYVDLEGIDMRIEPNVPDHGIWLHPHEPTIYFMNGDELERRPLGGTGELLGLYRRPRFMSRSRRFAAVNTPSDPLDDPALVDLMGELEPLPAVAVETPNDDPLCHSYALPGYWFDQAEARAFVFPGPDSALLHVPLDDPGATQTVDVGAGFRPLGYDLCREALIGRLPDGSILTADHDGSIATLAPPFVPSNSSPVVFSPSGNVMVTTSYSALERSVLVADLVAGTWISIELPDSLSSMNLVMASEEHALVETLDGDGMPTAYRVTLASGELLSVPTCGHGSPPALTEDGQVVLCMDTAEGTVLGVQRPGEPMLALGSYAGQAHVLPSDPGSSSCVDTEPETHEQTLCR